jgi:hypothetical protein
MFSASKNMEKIPVITPSPGRLLLQFGVPQALQPFLQGFFRPSELADEPLRIQWSKPGISPKKGAGFHPTTIHPLGFWGKI